MDLQAPQSSTHVAMQGSFQSAAPFPQLVHNTPQTSRLGVKLIQHLPRIQETDADPDSHLSRILRPITVVRCLDGDLLRYPLLGRQIGNRQRFLQPSPCALRVEETGTDATQLKSPHQPWLAGGVTSRSTSIEHAAPLPETTQPDFCDFSHKKTRFCDFSHRHGNCSLTRFHTSHM